MLGAAIVSGKNTLELVALLLSRVSHGLGAARISIMLNYYSATHCVALLETRVIATIG